MEWVELMLPGGAIPEEVAALLGDLGIAASGVEVRGTDVVIWAPAAEAEAALAELRVAAARLREHGFDVDPAAARVRPAAPEDEWRDAWKRYFHVVRVTPRIVIVPSWERYDPAADDIVLDLDPGRAFGTGAHASTRLVLRALDALAASGRAVGRLLDVGTGSGILAIAAAKLWPGARGVAIDIDPIACGAARENLERNGVGSVTVDEGDVATVDGNFDLVVANIQADVLLALRDGLVARLGSGALVLSGLLLDQVEPIAAAYEDAGLQRWRVDTLDEWAAVVLSR
jgi:ribosomal protein L11 methyltransferase